ncbi:hypothetical protein ACFPOE_13635 [Caenimonas terrae]|uniref:CYTH domain-containing protein n=1 Tax=Caenimonas terrae TaxID=696074 RepID=A0ABW0NG56_9BURK
MPHNKPDTGKPAGVTAARRIPAGARCRPSVQQSDAQSFAPKYSLVEIERRWIADLSSVGSLEGLAYRDIEDLYVRGTRLRLRKVTAQSGEVELKFCKKYGRGEGLAEAITNLYLSPREYESLAALPGRVLRKRRYSYCGGALDFYPAFRFAMFEVEFDSVNDAQCYVVPAFVRREVTDDEDYSGGSLAARTA